MTINKGVSLEYYRALVGGGGGGVLGKSGKSDYEPTEILPGHSPVPLGDK